MAKAERMIIPLSDVEIAVREIVDTHCPRWSEERKEALREAIRDAMFWHASEVAEDTYRHTGSY